MLNKYVTSIVEHGVLPDFVLRFGIRQLLRKRLKSMAITNGGSDALEKFVVAMNQSAVAELPEKANEQHYELPPEFFINSLGEHLKYSCGYWPDDSTTLDASELIALKLTVERAELINGQSILELGCGWGSLSLFMASMMPDSQITSVSNSHSQADYIRRQADNRGITNLSVITCDMNDFNPQQLFNPQRRFDRVVSVEMFEHMRNWQELFARVSTWLNQNGRFFMHIFVHKDTPYFYEDESEDDWMTRYFFSGGIMPSASLPSQFNQHLSVEQQWLWSGTHYAKTANAWLARMDARKDQLFPFFESTYGLKLADIWWVRWRLFYMACAELFAFNNGDEWMVGHYLLSQKN